MEGDAFSILDCCMASLGGMKGKTGLGRIYQLLAASSADAETCGPGANSFTSALCDSLEELSRKANGGPFLSTELVERINTKRRAHPCQIWDRLRQYKKAVQLGRLDKTPSLEDSFSDEGLEQASLLIHFSLKTSDLTDGQIERLAAELPCAFKDATIPLRRVDWVNMSARKPQTTRIPVRLNVSFGPEDESVLEAAEMNEMESFPYSPTKIRGHIRAVSTAQKWRSQVRRKHDDRARCLEVNMGYSTHASTWFMAVKLSGLLFMFGLLFFREDRTGLVLWSALVGFMLLCGPCRASAIRECMR
jgi:hypothetical protein